jgi:20S proteasome subunit alpha 6
MFRNQYDTDATTFSPNGRLFQVEYAMEAVKQGSGVVGVRSNDFVVVASLKRAASALASYQQKIWKIDDHMGMGISGLTSDARVLAKYMQTECLNHKFVYDAPMQTSRLVVQVSDKAQVFTQKSEKRPYGVGLLVAGYDKTGPHLFQTLPNGNYYDYKAIAMGARSQGAKTYLEKVFESFETLQLDALIMHALIALKATSPKPLTAKSVAVGYVGKNTPFTILEDDKVRSHVAAVSDDLDAVDDDKKNVASDSVSLERQHSQQGSAAKSSTATAGTSSTSGSTSSGTDQDASMDEDV